MMRTTNTIVSQLVNLADGSLFRAYEYDPYGRELNYRYYACCKAMKRGLASCPTSTLPAQTLESAVVEQVRQRLSREVQHNNKLEDDAAQVLLNEATWHGLAGAERARRLRQLVSQVVYDRASGRMVITLLDPADAQSQSTDGTASGSFGKSSRARRESA